jgi:hypothetical protein
MRIFASIISICLLIGVISCSSDPKPPQFRVKNEGSKNASLQVKTSGGNTININNVAPGTTSAYQGVAAGGVDITVSIQGDPAGYTASFTAVTDKTFTILISATTPPTVTVVSP